jgi:hypothetical protein
MCLSRRTSSKRLKGAIYHMIILRWRPVQDHILQMYSGPRNHDDVSELKQSSVTSKGGEVGMLRSYKGFWTILRSFSCYELHAFRSKSLEARVGARMSSRAMNNTSLLTLTTWIGYE